MEPNENSKLQKQYNAYLQNPSKKYKNPDELELLAFEVGRLAGTKRIYGIDYQESYNYGIANDIEPNHGTKT